MEQNQSETSADGRPAPVVSRFHKTSLVLLVVIGVVVLLGLIYAGYYAWQNSALQ